MQCLICEEKFDKTNKDMVKAWYVGVREKENKVNLMVGHVLLFHPAIIKIKELIKALALCTVSLYSFSGMLSATMPAPDCT